MPQPIPTVRNVTMLIGAHAYACIEHEYGKLDIQLSAGRGAQTSLRQTARQSLSLADDRRRSALTAAKAADWLDVKNMVATDKSPVATALIEGAAVVRDALALLDPLDDDGEPIALSVDDAHLASGLLTMSFNGRNFTVTITPEL